MTEQQKQLVADNHQLIYEFLQNHDLSVDEYYDLAAIGLCEAAIAFNPEISSFMDLAYSCMYETIEKDANKETVPKKQMVYFQAEKQNKEGSIYAAILGIPSNENVEEQAVSSVSIHKFMYTLKERELQIFNLLDQGFTQCQISEKVGITQAGVSRVRARIIRKLTAVCQQKRGV